MTKSIKLALAATMALSATSAFATNGDHLIGTGAKSRAMGGTGIAHSNGAESATTNPALITKNKGVQFTFGGTYFRPDVEVDTTDFTVPAQALNPSAPAGSPDAIVANGGSYESEAKHNVIPYVALTHNLENGFVIGASMYGSAGMGTDWRDDEPNLSGTGFGPAGVYGDGSNTFGLFSMRSNLLLLKFSVPIAYGQDNWSVGIAPVMMYGSLDISFKQPNFSFANPTGTGNSSFGNGSSSDFGLGFEAGAAYTLPDLGLTIGAKYASAIEMTYDDQISDAAQRFGFGLPVSEGGTGLPGYSDNLEQPAEVGIGADWTQGDISVTADVKQILWSDAEGYEDFNWDDQTVVALGAEYRINDLSLRLGFNYAENPIDENKDTTVASGNGNTVGDTINTFNAVMFPAITEMHYTMGVGYQFSKNVSADFAFTYGTSDDEKYAADSVGLGTIEVTNDQIAVSGNLNYTF